MTLRHPVGLLAQELQAYIYLHIVYVYMNKLMCKKVNNIYIVYCTSLSLSCARSVSLFSLSLFRARSLSLSPSLFLSLCLFSLARSLSPSFLHIHTQTTNMHRLNVSRKRLEKRRCCKIVRSCIFQTKHLKSLCRGVCVFFAFARVYTICVYVCVCLCLCLSMSMSVYVCVCVYEVCDESNGE